MGLYLENGYINFEWIDKQGCRLVVLVGPRGTGKSYSILDYFRKREKIIYARRTKTQMIMAADHHLNIYKQINIDKGCNVVSEFCKDSYAVFSDEKDEKKEIALGIPLNTFYNVRGFSAADYNTLFFDEVVPEPTEPRKAGEEKAFLNMIETINRNRELSGNKPIKIILAGNSDSLNVPIFRALNLIGTIEKIVKKGQEIYINKEKGIMVLNLINSPIAQKKSQTFLYQQTKNKGFVDMAINNKFRDLDAADEHIKANVPLQEYIPLYCVEGEIFAYRHKNRSEYYFTEKKSGEFKKNYNLYLTSEKREFIMKEKKSISMLIDRKCKFSSFDVKSKIENALF